MYVDGHVAIWEKRARATGATSSTPVAWVPDRTVNGYSPVTQQCLLFGAQVSTGSYLVCMRLQQRVVACGQQSMWYGGARVVPIRSLALDDRVGLIE